MATKEDIFLTNLSCCHCHSWFVTQINSSSIPTTYFAVYLLANVMVMSERTLKQMKMLERK